MSERAAARGPWPLIPICPFGSCPNRHSPQLAESHLYGLCQCDSRMTGLEQVDRSRVSIHHPTLNTTNHRSHLRYAGCTEPIPSAVLPCCPRYGSTRCVHSSASGSGAWASTGTYMARSESSFPLAETSPSAPSPLQCPEFASAAQQIRLGRLRSRSRGLSPSSLSALASILVEVRTHEATVRSPEMGESKVWWRWRSPHASDDASTCRTHRHGPWASCQWHPRTTGVHWRSAASTRLVRTWKLSKPAPCLINAVAYCSWTVTCEEISRVHKLPHVPTATTGPLDASKRNTMRTFLPACAMRCTTTMPRPRSQPPKRQVR